VLNAVVEIEVCQVESVLPVTSLQHIGSEVGYKKAEAWREVVSSSDLVRNVGEFDIFAVMWEDACPETKKEISGMVHSQDLDSN
jgi:hypothetical protein